MKKSIKIGLLALLSVATFSCKEGFEEINAAWDKPTEASTPEIFNAVVSSLPLTAGEQSVMNSWIYPITQQAVVSTGGAYPYDNARNAVWQNFYFTLANIRILEDRISKEANPSSYNNVSAMLKTINAYKAFKATNYFGDMPYTEAGYAALTEEKGSQVYKAAYDTQPAIYKAILDDLNWAIDNFSTSGSQFSLGSYETLLDGNIEHWVRFANSLRLYIALTAYDKDQALATPYITASMSKPFLSGDETVAIWPAKRTLSLQWREWSFNANCYLRMGSTIWENMSSDNAKDGSGIFDPRAKVFFEPNHAGEWVAYPQNPGSGVSEGGLPYDRARYTDWSKKDGTLYSPFNLYFVQDMTTIPEPILTVAQVHLLKAEVYNRGIGVSANPTQAKAEYEAGIRASVDMWKSVAFNSEVWTVGKPASATATPAEISAMLASPKVAYNTGNAADGLKKIYTQLWIDQFRQPFDAWTLKRRTGDATPMSAVNPQIYQQTFAGFQRFLYPEDELTYNSANFMAATGGANKNDTKLWFAR
ncbi:MAG: SusD/RagB family nutrient-binding outer membrane lipoprotein [Leadbetterella sp.]|nr:SusD/RagB family nutrient-binding outer membrane lipoprotein [Leadbetterella sp.]